MDKKLYDFTSLKEVCAGDESFMEKMIDLFLTNTPKELDQIGFALENGDYITVKSIVHKMKPSVTYMCIPVMLDDIREIEGWEEIDEKMTEKTARFIQNISLVLYQIRAFKQF